MGERERILSRHLSSVWKCSGSSSHFIAMLQIGHTAWSDLNLLLERLERSSASSYLLRREGSGLVVVEVVGGRGRNGLGKGKAEGVKLLVTEVLALESQACWRRVWRCWWWTAMWGGSGGSPGIILVSVHRREL